MGKPCLHLTVKGDQSSVTKLCGVDLTADALGEKLYDPEGKEIGEIVAVAWHLSNYVISVEITDLIRLVPWLKGAHIGKGPPMGFTKGGLIGKRKEKK